MSSRFEIQLISTLNRTHDNVQSMLSSSLSKYFLQRANTFFRLLNQSMQFIDSSVTFIVGKNNSINQTIWSSNCYYTAHIRFTKTCSCNWSTFTRTSSGHGYELFLYQSFSWEFYLSKNYRDERFSNRGDAAHRSICLHSNRLVLKSSNHASFGRRIFVQAKN